MPPFGDHGASRRFPRGGAAALLLPLLLLLLLLITVSACGAAGDDKRSDAGPTFLPFNGGPEELAACATTQAPATLKPVNLVFLYDKSASMGSRTRRYTCGGGGIDCETFAVSAVANPYESYVCYRAGESNKVAFDEFGGVTFEGRPCTPAAFGQQPASLCHDPSACALTSFFDPLAKWLPVGQAAAAFFADRLSTTMTASLTFFPKASGPTLGCNPNEYLAPEVPARPLPDPVPFAGAIGGAVPHGDTPTAVALTGTLAYARSLVRPDRVTAIALVTDGDPTLCASQPAAAQDLNGVMSIVRAAATDAASPIKTYVIGVGTNLGNLHAIAEAGGTERAILTSVADPTRTAAEFRAALEKVRGSLLSCDLALPAAPPGKTLDTHAVNVVAKINGREDVLTYSKDCASGVGWRYDDANAPTRVLLCADACGAARAENAGRVSVAVGCATKGGVIR